MSPRATLIENQSCRSMVDRIRVTQPIKLGVVGLGHRAVGNVIAKTVQGVKGVENNITVKAKIG